MKTKEELHQYWQNPNDKNNSPELYLDNEITLRRSKYLYEVISKHFTTDIKILELGSNVGRNLNYLYKKGYKNLLGIEINKNAIEIMTKEYPELSKNVGIVNNPIEEVIGQFDDKHFDLIFSMAVLEHIHHDSEWIFGEMIRISKNMLIIENETTISDRHFPRNYEKIFGTLMAQVDSQRCGKFNGLSKRFVMRLFL
jgi:2-polyprenyl-3-methyl-5-hydroxy-6-metoxy-1,4-benzoquinol methylase